MRDDQDIDDSFCGSATTADSPVLAGATAAVLAHDSVSPGAAADRFPNLLPRPEQIWPPERTAELLRLRERAMSARQIARELGVTRNAVIGKLHRLKLTIVQVRVTTDRHRQQRREQAARRRARERAARGPERDVRPRPARQGPTRAPVPGKVNIWGLTENACRWPLFGGNEPVSEQFYCGGEAVLGASYCGVHCKQSFGPSRPPMGRR